MSAADWMRVLPFDYNLSKTVYLCHGLPTDDMIYLLEEVGSGLGLSNVRDDVDMLTLSSGVKADIIGYTHLPRTITLSTGQIVITIGSVGYSSYEDELPIAH